MADAQDPPRSEPKTRVVHVVHPPQYRPASVWDFLTNLLGFVLAVAVIAVSGRGIWNVAGSAGDVMALADQVACQGEPPGCTTRISYLERRPWGHLYNLTTPGKAKSIWCQREAYVFGDWSCTTTASVIDTVPPPVTIYVPVPVAPRPTKKAAVTPGPTVVPPGPTAAPSASP